MGYTARLLVVLFFAVLLAAVPARASCDANEPGCDDAQTEQEDNISRQLTKQTVSSESAEIESKGRDEAGGSESVFHAKIDLTGYSGGNGKILRIEIDYKAETSSSEAEVEFELSPMTWIEYLENANSTAGYDAGVDTVVSSFPLQNCQWAPFDAQGGFKQVTIGAATVQNLTITMSCNNGPTTVFRFYVTDKPVTLGDQLISAKSIKFDIVMSGYPYKDSTNQSRIALEVRARGKSELEVRTSGNNTAPSNDGFVELEDSNNSSVSAWFKWKSTLDKPAGAAVAVKQFAPFSGYADVTAGTTDNRAFLSFVTPQPAVVEWDPVTGVTAVGSAAAQVVAFGLILAMLALLVL